MNTLMEIKSGLTRRSFLAASATAAALMAWSVPMAIAAPGDVGEMPGDHAGLNILILGGTSLTGPNIVATARERGHHVTVFNRGRTEKRKGSVGDDVDRLVGDRDPNKDDGLKALEGDRMWDVVIDTSGFYPRHVRASAELLAKRTKHYIFVSTISVYKDGMPKNSDESAPLNELADPTTEDMAGGLNYGGLKVLCERAVQEVYGQNACIVRPGLIVGPGDDSDRFTYWPIRVAQGGDVLCPGNPADPIQFIDCRDLGAWLVTCAEKHVTGVFNAAGPVPGITIGDLINTCKAQSKSNANLIWASASFLEEQKVSAWADMPVWVPPDSESGGMTTSRCDKAVAAGLKFRPAADTVRDVLEWWPKEVARRDRVGKELVAQAEKDGKPAPKLPPAEKLRAGISPEREADVIKLLKEKGGAGK